MRSLSSLTLAMLTSIAVIAAPLTFNGSAMAANTHAKLAHKSRTTSPKRHRSAQASCARPLRFSAEQLIPAMLSLPLVPGPRDALIIDGVRVPIGDCGPATVDPNTGAVIDNRPTASGSAWIARAKRNASRQSSRKP
jgi:hypothetical protein